MALFVFLDWMSPPPDNINAFAYLTPMGEALYCNHTWV